jgi:glycosyltransferase involved in cell wall biosynthesis
LEKNFRELSVPTVSIIVPNFNTENYLKRCIGSVQAQSFADWELLLVDDGSKVDPTPFIPEDSRIKVLWHESNRGLAAARNTGIKASTGKYIATLDSDDYWLPTKLERMVAFFEANPQIEMAFHDFRHELADGTSVDWQGGMKQRLANLGIQMRSVVGGDEFTESIMHPLIRLTSFIHPSTFMIRRECLEKTGLFNEDYRIAEDLEMWVRVGKHCKAGIVDEVLSHVEQRPNSLGHNRLKLSEGIVRLYRSIADEDATLPGEVRQALESRLLKEHMDLGWEYIQRNEFTASRKNYREAKKYGGGRLAQIALLKTYIPSSIRKLLQAN